MATGKPKSDESRTQARCQQVLEAARLCFQEHGFHNASMATIAKTAGMSVGHIYHYFENKEAIIAAIVARDEAALQSRVQELAKQGDIFQAMVDRSDGGLDRSMDTSESALLMEILAEVLRSPRIAEIIHASDLVSRRELGALINKARPPGQTCSQESQAAQVELLLAVFEGLKIRAIRNPGLQRNAVLALLRPVVQRILEG